MDGETVNDPESRKGSGSEVIRILLADDHGIVRAGLKALLDAQPDMAVVGEAEDGESAIRLVQELVPTVLVTDLSMPGGGMEAIRQVNSLHLPTRVLVLTVHAEERYLLPVLEAGGSGYVRKASAHTDLLVAIRRHQPLVPDDATREKRASPIT